MWTLALRDSAGVVGPFVVSASWYEVAVAAIFVEDSINAVEASLISVTAACVVAFDYVCESVRHAIYDFFSGHIFPAVWFYLCHQERHQVHSVPRSPRYAQKEGNLDQGAGQHVGVTHVIQFDQLGFY